MKSQIANGTFLIFTPILTITLSCVCRKFEKTPKIVGGDTIDIIEAPYQLQLLKNGYPTCGAVLVDSSKAVSAAHCFRDDFPNITYAILAGYNMRYNSSDPSMPKPVPVKYRVHPKYCRDKKNGCVASDNDIVVLTFSPLDLSEVVSPAYVLNEKFLGPLDGQMAKVSGWGRDADKEKGGEHPRFLKAVDVEIISTEKCRKIYRKFDIGITDNMICAGGNENEDSCNGDSGGPLVMNNIFLVGVVSFGIDCGRKNVPGVYTKISNYVDFILYNKV